MAENLKVIVEFLELLSVFRQGRSTSAKGAMHNPGAQRTIKGRNAKRKGAV